jgi:hypothetical protein
MAFAFPAGLVVGALAMSFGSGWRGAGGLVVMVALIPIVGAAFTMALLAIIVGIVTLARWARGKSVAG